MKTKIDSCHLCDQQKVLVESHIVPKFIFHWLKQTSPTGFIRGFNNPNIRRQDGLKKHLLCKECEDLFSEKEKWFREKIFIPINEDLKAEFLYDDRLYYFAASVLWRIAHYFSISDAELIKSKFLTDTKDYATNMKAFLLGGQRPDHKLFFAVNAGPLETTVPGLAINANIYFNRVVDPFVMFDNRAHFAYLQAPGFMLLGDIVGLDYTKMPGMEIHPDLGLYEARKTRLGEISVCSFVTQRLQGLDNQRRKMSGTQLNAIKQTIEKRGNREG